MPKYIKHVLCKFIVLVKTALSRLFLSLTHEWILKRVELFIITMVTWSILAVKIRLSKWKGIVRVHRLLSTVLWSGVVMDTHRFVDSTTMVNFISVQGTFMWHTYGTGITMENGNSIRSVPMIFTHYRWLENWREWIVSAGMITGAFGGRFPARLKHWWSWYLKAHGLRQGSGITPDRIHAWETASNYAVRVVYLKEEHQRHWWL